MVGIINYQSLSVKLPLHTNLEEIWRVILMDDAQNVLEQALNILKSIANNPNIPRNIRRVAREAYSELRKEEYTVALRAANAIEKLTGVLDEPQIPLFARTSLLQVIELLDKLTKVEES